MQLAAFVSWITNALQYAKYNAMHKLQYNAKTYNATHTIQHNEISTVHSSLPKKAH